MPLFAPSLPPSPHFAPICSPLPPSLFSPPFSQLFSISQQLKTPLPPHNLPKDTPHPPLRAGFFYLKKLSTRNRFWSNLFSLSKIPFFSSFFSYTNPRLDSRNARMAIIRVLQGHISPYSQLKLKFTNFNKFNFFQCWKKKKKVFKQIK